MILRRGKVKEVSESVRKGIANALGIDVSDIDAYIVEDIVYNIVDSYSAILSKDEPAKTAGKAIVKLCEKLRNVQVESKTEK